MHTSLRKGLCHAAIALASATALGAQQPESPFTINGYLTQAYGVSRGGMVAGLGQEGTSDYRRVAILGRYQASPSNHFVVQIANRRLGDSPTMQFEDDIKLDMAYYEHRFDQGTRVRLGKSVMPYGIYNEIRYAGTLQPFYRAPLSIYWEGTYTSETIDGVLASHRFRAGQPWEISLDAFGGGYNFLEFGTIQPSPTEAPIYTGGRLKATNAFGAQLWVTTPIEGLRIGGGARRHTDRGGIYPRPDGMKASEWAASVDGSFEKWMARAEFTRINAGGVIVEGGYAQLGFRPVPLFSVNVQSEVLDINAPIAPGVTPNVKFVRDYAAGVNVFLNSMTVFKVEAHTTKGFNIEQPTNWYGAPIKGSYFIASFSVSF